jgi:glyoxylase-like metal-dependent hydrolase (beta-lactamase superfamily II)
LSESFAAKRNIGSCEIAQGIHLIESAMGERILRQFLLVGDNIALLVDTGIDSTPRDFILPYLEQIHVPPSRIRYILVTHCDFDHQGGNVTARELFPQAIFLSHEQDEHLIESIDRLIEQRYGEFRNEHGIEDSDETKAWIRAVSRSETPIDIALRGEESIRLNAEWSISIMHTPGHSLGHLTAWDARSRTAIIADTALGSCLPTRDGRSAFPPTYRYVHPYRRSIQKLRRLKASTLLTSHYPVMSGAEVDQFLVESAGFTHRVEVAVQNELASSAVPLSTHDLIARLSPLLGTWPKSAGITLVYPIVGHLERLLAMDLVRKVKLGSHLGWISTRLGTNSLVRRSIPGGI